MMPMAMALMVGPPLTALRYVKYFRFVDDVMFYTVETMGQETQGSEVKSVIYDCPVLLCKCYKIQIQL